jgi:hypothetical protein
MAQVQNVDKVIAALKQRAAEAAKDSGSVVCGFGANYALAVHEKVGMTLRGQKRPKPLPGVYWGPHGQAKFLEGPARSLANSGEFARIVQGAVKAGKSLMDGLLLCGLRLLRESQMVVPVVSGNLRASGFVRREQ